MASVCIPEIDMKDFPGQSGKLIAACEEWGCFRIINHGIPITLLSEMKSVARSLLDLPVDVKQRTADAIAGKGYSPPDMANPLLEGLGVYDMASPGAIDSFCDQLNATPQQRETILKYSHAVHELAQYIGQKLVDGMGLDVELFKEWPCQFRMNKYHYTPQTIGSTGALMHTDAGFLTIVQDDDIVSGLEAVDKKSGALVPIDPVPGTLLINIGDLGKAWSNGRFYNVKHRVQCNEGTTRMSIALFVLGPKEAKVEAPPQLVDSAHPRLFVPFNFEDYRMLRITKRSPTGGALEFLRATSAA
ncbi:hypothetical protein F0562_035188 [Nyssa sinensis]|uniref:2-oxoglutarate-dependent dioxygenase DAO n=1 Tax=Nyssa sinensis TaxID=561372 RepID=A0A5J5AAF1_9ASTE|nr:hypothetical protein F0562_035188 [Nyssa sinensis]